MYQKIKQPDFDTILSSVSTKPSHHKKKIDLLVVIIKLMLIHDRLYWYMIDYITFVIKAIKCIIQFHPKEETLIMKKMLSLSYWALRISNNCWVDDDC